MAILKENPLGIISGRIGELIFRRRNGKIVVYKRPSPSTKPLSIGSINSRQNFKSLVHFSKYLNSVPLIHDLWIKSTKRSYLSIMKANAGSFVDFYPSKFCQICPPGQFDLFIFYNKLSDRTLNFSFIQIPDLITPETESVEMVCVNTWFAPLNSEIFNPFESFLSVHSFSPDQVRSDNSQTIEDRVSPSSTVAHYTRKMLFFFFIIHNPGGIVLHSDSYCAEV